MKKIPFSGRYAVICLSAIALPSGFTAASNLPEIKVEASAENRQTPIVEKLDQLAIQNKISAISDTASLLKGIPGVSINQAGGVSGLPAIRGLADDRIRIQVDNMDQIASCPNHMNPPLSTIAPQQVDDIQVYQGISPVSLGGDSIAGTIVVNSKKAAFAEPDQIVRKGQFSVFGATNNNAVSTGLSLSQANDEMAIQYDGNWSRADNYTAGDDFKTSTATGRPGQVLALDEVGSSAYEIQTHKVNLRMKAAQGEWDVNLGYQKTPEQLYPNQRMDMLDNEQTSIQVAYTHFHDSGESTLSLYHEIVDHYMNFGDDKQFVYPGTMGMTDGLGMPMYSEGMTSGLKFHYDYEMDAQRLLKSGVELQIYRLDDYWTASGRGMAPGTFENIDNGQRDRYAIFTELETSHNDKWQSLIGVRYEQVRSDADEVRGYSVDPTDGTSFGMTNADAATFNNAERSFTDHNIDLTASFAYQYDDNMDVDFGFARKVRSPNLYERYTWSTWGMAAIMNNFVGDGNGYVGNLQLDPEAAHTLSATFDWHAPDQSWKLSAQPFYSYVTDFIDAKRIDYRAPPMPPGVVSWDGVNDAYGVLQYENYDAELYGVDLAFHYPLSQLLTLSGTINYVQGKNLDTHDGLYNIMPLNGLFVLSGEYGVWHNRLEWELVDHKDDVSEVRNEVETAGYGLLHWKGNWRKDNIRFDFGVTNIFDRFYELPTGGVYTGQGTTMSINGIDYGIAMPGEGRSFFAGVTVDF